MTDFKEHKAEMAIKAIQIIRDNLQIKSSKLLGACDYADWHTQGDMYNWMVLAKARRKYPVLYNQCYKRCIHTLFKLFLLLSIKRTFSCCRAIYSSTVIGIYVGNTKMEIFFKEIIE